MLLTCRRIKCILFTGFTFHVLKQKTLVTKLLNLATTFTFHQSWDNRIIKKAKFSKSVILGNLSSFQKLWHVSFNSSMNRLSAQWTICECWCTLIAANEMSARQENNADLFVHADLASSFFFQTTIFALQIWEKMFRYT